MKAKDTFTSGEVARLLGIPARTARNYLMTGRIPATQNPITGTWTIAREPLEAFMREHGLEVKTARPGARILVVDDEPPVTAMVVRFLRRANMNLEIEQTNDGYDALIRMGKAAPDLVILDSRMPNTDGEHVLHVLRSNPATATIRVLAISGFQEDLDKLRQLGSDAELLKPFGKRALLAKILPLLPGLATKES